MSASRIEHRVVIGQMLKGLPMGMRLIFWLAKYMYCNKLGSILI